MLFGPVGSVPYAMWSQCKFTARTGHGLPPSQTYAESKSDWTGYTGESQTNINMKSGACIYQLASGFPLSACSRLPCIANSHSTNYIMNDR